MKKKNSKIWGSHRRKVMSKSVWEQGTEMIGGGGEWWGNNDCDSAEHSMIHDTEPTRARRRTSVEKT
jgi:hypothetical protein